MCVCGCVGADNIMQSKRSWDDKLSSYNNVAESAMLWAGILHYNLYLALPQQIVERIGKFACKSQNCHHNFPRAFKYTISYIELPRN